MCSKSVVERRRVGMQAEQSAVSGLSAAENNVEKSSSELEWSGVVLSHTLQWKDNIIMNKPGQK